MENRLTKKVESLERALDDFNTSMHIEVDKYPELVADTIRNGQVQKFEFSVELLWKTLKIFLLDVHGVDAPSPKMVIKEFYNLGYGDATLYEMLLQAVNMRNELAHVYNKALFETHYLRIIELRSVLNQALAMLKQDGGVNDGFD